MKVTGQGSDPAMWFQHPSASSRLPIAGMEVCGSGHGSIGCAPGTRDMGLFCAEPLFAAGQLFTSSMLLVWLICSPFGEDIEVVSTFSMPSVMGCESFWKHSQCATRSIRHTSSLTGLPR